MKLSQINRDKSMRQLLKQGSRDLTTLDRQQPIKLKARIQGMIQTITLG